MRSLTMGITLMKRGAKKAQIYQFPKSKPLSNLSKQCLEVFVLYAFLFVFKIFGLITPEVPKFDMYFMYILHIHTDINIHTYV